MAKDGVFQIRIDTDLKNKFIRIASAQGTSGGELLEGYMEKYVEENKQLLAFSGLEIGEDTLVLIIKLINTPGRILAFPSPEEYSHEVSDDIQRLCDNGFFVYSKGFGMQISPELIGKKSSVLYDEGAAMAGLRTRAVFSIGKWGITIRPYSQVAFEEYDFHVNSDKWTERKVLQNKISHNGKNEDSEGEVWIKVNADKISTSIKELSSWISQSYPEYGEIQGLYQKHGEAILAQNFLMNRPFVFISKTNNGRVFLIGSPLFDNKEIYVNMSFNKSDVHEINEGLFSAYSKII